MTYVQYSSYSAKISKESVKYNRSHGTKFKYWVIISIVKSTGEHNTAYSYKSWWTIIERSHVQAFMLHRTTINKKIGWSSTKRMDYKNQKYPHTYVCTTYIAMYFRIIH